MTAQVQALPSGAPAGRPGRSGPSGRSAQSSGLRRLTPASGLGLGVALVWFSVLVLLPLAAVAEYRTVESATVLYDTPSLKGVKQECL